MSVFLGYQLCEKKKRKKSQSHPKGIMLVIYGWVTSYIPEPSGFIAPPFLRVRNLGVARLGSLALDLSTGCKQGVGWGCSPLSWSGKASASRLTHMVVGGFSSSWAVRVRGSVLRNCWLEATLASLPCGSPHHNMVARSVTDQLRGQEKAWARRKSVFIMQFWKWHPSLLPSSVCQM